MTDTENRVTQKVFVPDKHAGAELYAGVVVFRKSPAGGGWQFMPYFQASPSRKLWESPERAIGRRLANYRLVPATAGTA